MPPLFLSKLKRDGRSPHQAARPKRVVYVLLLIAWGLLVIACADPDLVCDDPLGCVRIGANDSIEIAYLLALSGEAGYLGQDSLRGIELALLERDNLFMDHPVEMVGQDTECIVEQGRVAALETAENPLIIGVIGSTCSAVTEVVIPIIDRAGQIIISPSSARADLPMVDRTTTGDWQQSFFRTVPNTLWQGRVAAEFAVNSLGVTTAVVVYDETEGSNALRLTFTEAFTALGGHMLFEWQMISGQTDVSNVVEAVNQDLPILLYLPLFEPEASLLINNLPLNGERFLLGADSLLLPSFAVSTGMAAEGMALTGPAATGTAYEAFLEQWLVAYGDEPIVPYHIYAYDAVNMLLTAMATVAQEGRNGVLLIGRQALREAMAQMVFEGVSGQFMCQDSECNSQAAIGIYQLTEAEIVGRHWPPPLIWQPPKR